MLGLAGMIGADARVSRRWCCMRAPLGRRGSYLATGPQRPPVPRLGDVRADRDRAAAAALSDRAFGVPRHVAVDAPLRRLAPCSRSLGPVGFVRRCSCASSASGSCSRRSSISRGGSSTTATLGASGAPRAAAGRFWLAVDLVIALPVSWIPLVADYTRFSRSAAPRSRARGRLPRCRRSAPVRLRLDARALASARSAGTTARADHGRGRRARRGCLALLALTVDETDEAFANVYSTAVSLQNCRRACRSAC